ncbi:MAG: hypothetical protein ACM3NI_02830 [Bacteroidota bacterium]
MPETAPHYTEGERRLHALVRTLLSPGVWMVLAAQIVLVFLFQSQAPAEPVPLVAALTTFLTAAALMLFFYLEAGAFHGLTLSREALSVGQVFRGAVPVFARFLWLTVKAGMLLVVLLNIVFLLAMLATGSEPKTLTAAFYRFISPVAGMAAFIFAYWLPFVFVRREFRLFVSLRAALRIARARLSRSVFLALLILVPMLLAGLLPDDLPAPLALAVNAFSGLLGWIAYVYCVETLQELPPAEHVATSPES